MESRSQNQEEGEGMKMEESGELFWREYKPELRSRQNVAHVQNATFLEETKARISQASAPRPESIKVSHHCKLWRGAFYYGIVSAMVKP